MLAGRRYQELDEAIMRCIRKYGGVSAADLRMLTLDKIVDHLHDNLKGRRRSPLKIMDGRLKALTYARRICFRDDAWRLMTED